MAGSSAPVGKYLTNEDYNQLINEWKASLRERKPCKETFDSYPESLTTQDFLQSVQGILTKIRKFMKTVRRDYRESKRQADGEPVSTSTLYAFVKQKIEEIVAGLHDLSRLNSTSSTNSSEDSAEGEGVADNLTPNCSELRLLTTWCAEMWFMTRLEQHRKRVDESYFAGDEDFEYMFSEYIESQDEDQESKIFLMARHRCYDMVKKLMELMSNAADGDYVFDCYDVAPYILPADLDKELIKILGEYSESRLVPFDDSTMKRYAIHLPIQKDYPETETSSFVPSEVSKSKVQQEVKSENHYSVREGKSLTESLVKRGFTSIPLPDNRFTPDNAKFDDFVVWLGKELDKEHVRKGCSLLFISIFCEGRLGYLWDSEEICLEIRILLELINKNEDLKSIPKFLLLQTCQRKLFHKHPNFKYYELDETGIMTVKEKRLTTPEEENISLGKLLQFGKFPNTHLLMAAVEGERYWYIEHIGTIISIITQKLNDPSESATLTYLEDIVEAVFDGIDIYYKNHVDPDSWKYVPQHPVSYTSEELQKKTPLPPGDYLHSVGGNTANPQEESDDE